MNTIDAFHHLYYKHCIKGKDEDRAYWLGIRVGKCPLDCWVMQEIIYETSPSVIIECGTAIGGTALFFANMLDLLGGDRKVITIDRRDHRSRQPEHPRINYLVGNSVSPEIFESVTKQIEENDRVMVNLDSTHGKPHVLQELELYAPLITLGCYLIVDDTNIGHPLKGCHTEPMQGRGPWEAVVEFLERHPEFEADRSREKFLITLNPMGYLRRHQ